MDKCSVLLRYTAHDGLPTAPMEFLMSNRFVITNADMPFVEKIEGNFDEEGTRKIIIEKLRRLKKQIRKGLVVPVEATDYYKNYLDNGKIIKRLNAIVKT